MNVRFESINPQLTNGIISQCHACLNRIGKLNPERIQQLSPEVKNKLREYSPERIQELAKLNCFAADKIKTNLDKRFGEGNYIVIAIGRSLSSIVELLGHMGVDTKIIPLSGLRKREVNDISPDNLRLYKTFLVQKGLSKTDLEQNKDKKYIIMDYTHYGLTLQKAESMLKREDMLGNADNLMSLSIKDVLGDDYIIQKFEYIFQYCRFKNYSYVGKLHIDNLSDVYNQCSPERLKRYQGNITQGMRKLFWFNVFDSLNEGNYKRIFPQKEIEAIYEHHLSATAVKNYLNSLCRKQQEDIKTLKNNNK